MGKKKDTDVSKMTIDEEGNLVHIRNSERGTLARCPQQWYWSWREGLRPKESAKPLWFGTGIHEALAHYYGKGSKRNKDFIDVWRAFADEEADYIRVKVGGLDEDAFVEARVLGESMLTEYVKTYDGDRDWDVIATENSFQLAIPLFSGDDDRDTDAYKEWVSKGEYFDDWDLNYFLLDGTVDGVYREKSTGKIKIMEHKTAASISTRHLPMDNQAGTYWMVAYSMGVSQGWLKKNQNISEITYNFLRKAMPDVRPVDGNGYRTNKPLREHYLSALRVHEYPFDFDTKQNIKIPTIAVMEKWCEDNDIKVVGEVSKNQPPPLFERHAVRKYPKQRKMQLRRLQDDAQQMIALRSGQLHITKSPDRNTCPMCPYSEMCELHEMGGDWENYRDNMMRASDPYAAHRKSA